MYMGLDLLFNPKSLVLFEWHNVFSAAQWNYFFQTSGVQPPKNVLKIEIQLHHTSSGSGARKYDLSFFFGSSVLAAFD
jgi:hypothetical protein